MQRVEFRVGVGQNAIHDVIQRAEATVAAIQRGETVEATIVIRFETWALFFKSLTPTRIALLEYVNDHEGVASILALSQAVGRDYRAVHRDVISLIKLGLLGRHHGTITSQAEIKTASMVSI